MAMHEGYRKPSGNVRGAGDGSGSGGSNNSKGKEGRTTTA